MSLCQVHVYECAWGSGSTREKKGLGMRVRMSGCVCAVPPCIGVCCVHNPENSNNHDKEDRKRANAASTSGASGAGPVLAAIPAVSVTMTITERTLLVSLFVLKFPSL